ncbi:MAG: M23 family metallopeptidase [Bacillota bacterium]
MRLPRLDLAKRLREQLPRPRALLATLRRRAVYLLPAVVVLLLIAAPAMLVRLSYQPIELLPPELAPAVPPAPVVPSQTTPAQTTPVVEAPATVPEPVQPPPPPPPEVMQWPVRGGILVPFGQVYSNTLADWRFHAGIDIKTAQEAPIKAALSGTVASVFKDDALGWTVVLKHANGLQTRYASCHAVSTKAGRWVNQGEVIAVVGTSALSESLDGPHLHFEVRDAAGNALDPRTLLK